jgi:glutamate-5-semialdehyde dehydrogenase
MDNTRIPVLGHAAGVCHVYVHRAADLRMAERIVIDSKCQYPAVCNAAETLLVDEQIAGKFLPVIKKALEKNGVEIRVCPKTASFIEAGPAGDKDWTEEYLGLVLSIRTVPGVDEAIDHINRYGSGHTDAIVTSDPGRAARFMDLVDSASVFHNCSTRFSDGYRYGLGAEVGIATGKLHARGPVGVEGLTTYKWKLFGSGQIVADYTGPNAREFKHRRTRP